jgi:endo-1,4-beta-xylanase
VARHRAKDWNIDPDRVGMMGLSAGGQLVLYAATHFDAGQADAKDPVERESSHPAFQALIYSGPPLGDLALPKDVPPAFLCVAFDDKTPSHTAIDVFEKLRDAGGSAELHVYAKGGHGFGMRDRPLPITGWITRFHEWMVDQGLLKAGGSS